MNPKKPAILLPLSFESGLAIPGRGRKRPRLLRFGPEFTELKEHTPPGVFLT